MKREIKFRGKRDSGINDWVYGSLITAENSVDGKTYIVTKRINLYDKYRTISVQVNPETVGQYTQLKDKNGVEIYEGDLLQVDNKEPVEVRYEEIYASFGLWRKGFSFLHYFHEYVEPGDCEVIGNIHDKTQITKKEDEKFIDYLYERKEYVQRRIDTCKELLDTYKKKCDPQLIEYFEGRLEEEYNKLLMVSDIIEIYKTTHE